MADRTIRIIPARNRLDLPAEDRQKLRVAAYARVSTASDEQMGSVAAQKDYFEKLIQKKPDWELVEIYADEGISGTSLNHREAFNRMIADALDGKIDLIITKSLSRFARNTVDTLNTIRKLKVEGIGVYFEKEDITKLMNDYISTHPFDSGDSDCETVLDQLYQVYAESHESDPLEISASFKELEEFLCELPLEDNNTVFNLCCRLCSAYEHKAFIDGLQYGAHLMFELK